MGAIEQARIEIFLELTYLEGHGRLSHVQFFSRLGKAQQSSNGMEDLETAITHRLDIPRKTGADYMIFLCISTDEINLFDGNIRRPLGIRLTPSW